MLRNHLKPISAKHHGASIPKASWHGDYFKGESHPIVCITRKLLYCWRFCYFRMWMCKCVYLAVHEQPEGQSDVHAPFSEVLLTVHSGCGVRRRESHERSSRDIGAVQSDERFFFPFPFLSQFCNTHTHTQNSKTHQIILCSFSLCPRKMDLKWK